MILRRRRHGRRASKHWIDSVDGSIRSLHLPLPAPMLLPLSLGNEWIDHKYRITTRVYLKLKFTNIFQAQSRRVVRSVRRTTLAGPDEHTPTRMPYNITTTMTLANAMAPVISIESAVRALAGGLLSCPMSISMRLSSLHWKRVGSMNSAWSLVLRPATWFRKTQLSLWGIAVLPKNSRVSGKAEESSPYSSSDNPASFQGPL